MDPTASMDVVTKKRIKPNSPVGQLMHNLGIRVDELPWQGHYTVRMLLCASINSFNILFCI